MTTGLWIAIAAVVVAVAFGLYRSRTDGRFRLASTRRPVGEASPPDPAEVAQVEDTTWTRLAGSTPVAAGERATLVQFSTAFCAPCRATRRTLAEVAAVVPGVVHVEIDAEHHPELVRELGILRTPTTLVLDSTGREVARAAGAPRKEQVLGALGATAD